MAPLPPSNTARLFHDYVANGVQHTVMYRYDGSTNGGYPDAFFITALNDVYAELGDFMPTDWDTVGVRVAFLGSNISTPWAGWSPITIGQISPASYAKPAFMSAVGRSTDGRRARITWLGTGIVATDNTQPGQNDYRLFTSESTEALELVTAISGTAFLSISGQVPAWNPYLNLGFNAYWQHEVRG